MRRALAGCGCRNSGLASLVQLWFHDSLLLLLDMLASIMESRSSSPPRNWKKTSPPFTRVPTKIRYIKVPTLIGGPRAGSFLPPPAITGSRVSSEGPFQPKTSPGGYATRAPCAESTGQRRQGVQCLRLSSSPCVGHGWNSISSRYLLLFGARLDKCWGDVWEHITHLCP